MGHRLRNVTPTGELLFSKGFFPVRRGDGSALFYGRGIVILDFEVVAAWLFEINRIREVGFVRLGHAFEFILRFVIGEIFVRLRDLFGGPDPEAIVIAVRLVRSVRPALVDDQAPLGVGMLNYRLLFFPLHYFQREQVGKDRKCFVQRTAFIMPVDESDRFKHPLPPQIRLVIEVLQNYY